METTKYALQLIDRWTRIEQQYSKALDDLCTSSVCKKSCVDPESSDILHTLTDLMRSCMFWFVEGDEEGGRGRRGWRRRLVPQLLFPLLYCSNSCVVVTCSRIA